ncbi:MAG: hypothetical protein IT427_11305 [Pirellulales bacterium]|nr:hypothetical protein [Pirellulales bacterium]
MEWYNLEQQGWEGGFFNGAQQDDRDGDQLSEQLARLQKSLEEFRRLSDIAANHFDMPAEPNIWQGEELLHCGMRRGDRWIEKLYSLPELCEEVSGCAWRIRRLKADIFTASARGIEILYAKQAYNDALCNESNGDTSALGSEQFAEIVAAKLAGKLTQSNLSNESRAVRSRTKRKRQTNGDGRRPAAAKILAGLTQHHKYDNGIVHNFDPIVVRTIAPKWGVSVGALSKFLKENFGDYDGYVGKCNRREIAAELKRLGNEYTGRDTFELPDNL